MPDINRETESVRALFTSLDEVSDGIRQLKREREALLAAARFALSVLRANPMEMSERMAIEKLNAAISLATGPRT